MPRLESVESVIRLTVFLCYRWLVVDLLFVVVAVDAPQRALSIALESRPREAEAGAGAEGSRSAQISRAILVPSSSRLR